MVVMNARILLQDRAVMRIAQMRLQRQQPLAAGQPEKLVHHLEQLVIRLLAERRPFQALNEPVHQILEHLHRRHDHHRANRRPADRQNFRRMNQRADMPAGQRKATQHAGHHQHATNNDNHDIPIPSFALTAQVTGKCRPWSAASAGPVRFNRANDDRRIGCSG
jgi:hypothetical protein